GIEILVHEAFEACAIAVVVSELGARAARGKLCGYEQAGRAEKSWSHGIFPLSLFVCRSGGHPAGRALRLSMRAGVYHCRPRATAKDPGIRTAGRPNIRSAGQPYSGTG